MGAMKLKKEADKAEQLAKADFEKRQEAKKQALKKQELKKQGESKEQGAAKSVKAKATAKAVKTPGSSSTPVAAPRGLADLSPAIQVTLVKDCPNSRAKPSPIAAKKGPVVKARTISVRKDLVASKAGNAASPGAAKKVGPRAVKRLGGTASPIPVRKSSAIANIIAARKTPSAKSASFAKMTSGAVVVNPISVRRAPSSGKPSVVQNVAGQSQKNSEADCITIDD